MPPRRTLRLALAQINPTVGDLAGNAEKILRWAIDAREAGADLAVFPEMVLTGYPPEDLLLEPAFLRQTAETLKATAKALPRNIAVILGCPEGKPGALHNAAAVIFNGKVRGFHRKWFLPNYGVFDEKRYFEPGRSPFLINARGALVGLTVCEDIWLPGGPAVMAAKAGARLILNLSASPYHMKKMSERREIIRKKIRECRGAALAYCNAVGGQDELVYDGGSLVMDGRGKLLAQAPLFKEDLLVVDLDLPAGPKTSRALSLPFPPAANRPPLPPWTAAVLSPEEEVYGALVLGVRDYVQKNGFQKVVLGLSGGIDSSLVACVAADALGRGNVVGVTLPSRFNAPETRADAAALAKNLGIDFHAVSIDGLFQEFLKALAPLFGSRAPDVAEENIQARVRGTLLMALANKFGWLVLTTGNKSETSAGFFTLYGDSAGGFAVIKDVPKALVYKLCRWRNGKEGRAPIPQSVFDRPPTAELRPNQRDQDTLPPYDRLDRIVQLYVEESRNLGEIVRDGIEKKEALRALRMIDNAEYKRRQAPPGIKITPRAFGRDRRMPMTNKFRHE